MSGGPPTIEGMADLVEVGQGGFATVYRARNDRINRIVAIKVLRTSQLSDRDRLRFDRECHAMGALSWHPHVVAIHDTGATDDGRPYLVMEYLEHGSFADRIVAEGPMPWREAVSVGVHVAGALSAAHTAGTLHRDLKPENILVGPFGEAKLPDFGIAVVEGFGATTTAGSSALTLAHVAPEVLLGQRPDERSDIYALGSTVYTLIHGRPPFAKGELAMGALVMRVVNEPAPKLAGVPDQLADLLLRTMSKTPDERPSSAAAFGEALQAVERAEGVTPTVMRLTPGAGDSPTVPRRVDQRARPEASGPTIVTAPQDALDTADADAGATIAGASVPRPPTVPAPPAPASPATVTPERADPDAGGEPTSGADDDGARSPERRRRTGLLVASVVAALALGGVAVALLRPSGSSNDSSATPGSPVVATVEVGEGPGTVAATADDVWVSNFGDDTVTRIDPDDNSVVATIPVGGGPSGVALTDGAVWVAEARDGAVTRIDPSTDEVAATVETGSQPLGVAVGDGDIWAADFGDDTVTRIDGETDQVVATIAVGDGPTSIAATQDAIWVTNRTSKTVSRIDMTTNEVVASVDVGNDPGGISANETGVWVTNLEDDTVARIDPDTNVVVATIDAGNEPDAVAVTEELVWVANRRQKTITKIDPETNQTVATVDVPAIIAAIAATDEAVWVRPGAEREVYRVDPTLVP